MVDTLFDETAPAETMDRVLIYRNLLCAEDHIDEVSDSVASMQELEYLKDMKRAIESIRSTLGFDEVDSRYHCLTKHLAVAYEAAREVAKVTHNESDFERAALLRNYLKISLEHLLMKKIVNCGRCKEKYEQHNTSTQDDSGRGKLESDEISRPGVDGGEATLSS
jgi:hypothetical protein